MAAGAGIIVRGVLEKSIRAYYETTIFVKVLVVGGLVAGRTVRSRKPATGLAFTVA